MKLLKKLISRLSKIASLILLITLTNALLIVAIPQLQYRHFGARVVKIKGVMGEGTGFHLEYEGSVYLVTNKHVCEGNEPLYADKERLVILKISDLHDVCILESSRDTGFSYSLNRYPYMPLQLIGHPGGEALTVRLGHLINDVCEIMPWINQKECVPFFVGSHFSYPGNSGSPVLNLQGEVVGILFAGIQFQNDRGFVVPILFALEAIESIE